MGLADYLRIAVRHIVLIVVCVATAAGTAFFVTRAQPKKFLSSARFLVGPSPNLSQDDISQTVDALGRRAIVPTFSQVLTSGQIFSAAAERIRLPPQAALRYSVSAVEIPDANVVEARVKGTRAETVAALLDAVGSEATTYFDNLYKVYSVQRLNTPEVPETPISPTPKRDSVLAGVFGAAAGFGVALLKDRRRKAKKASAGMPQLPVAPLAEETNSAFPPGSPSFDQIYWRVRGLRETLVPSEEATAYRRLRARLAELSPTPEDQRRSPRAAVVGAGETPSLDPPPAERSDEHPGNGAGEQSRPPSAPAAPPGADG